MALNPAHMKMSELSQRSGIPVSTIKFYLRKGLLPKPRKTGETQAYYTLKHLDRLKLIQKIQKEGGMPLSTIREITQIIDSGEEREKKDKKDRTSSRRTGIIETAISIFREKGYESVTIADIVNAADIGRSTFYKNFKNKKELFVACIQKILIDEATALKVNGIDDQTDLPMIFEKHAEAFMRVDPIWRDMINMLRVATISDPAEFSDKLEEAMQLKIATYEKRIETGIRQGLLRKVNMKVLAVIFLGIQDYCSEYVSKGQFEETPDTILEAVNDILLHGILKK